ncbi:class A beta-lactamase [Piscinibacter gummiphilus]|uniref:Beta-lactamase n=1 Tax=Piscinibacter gummiphilus TaxID=946333 RepID=A0A1W6L688_9BURK|nr:class A beta-lactamase [Piscinibacter gummiphilus]ARN19774.1 class A beta-lactamase [Piscinibacter gummiphilus]ATU64446.1 class A beta-lactamase [Piscinibacter gummiphilus]GLS95153.1 beta-lactamase [Piscinibacter gummiphilus]
MDRRIFNAAAGLALAGWSLGASAQKTSGLADLERTVGGRLGVAVLDSATGGLTGRRLDERFPMCSTFKWLAAAKVLQRVDAGEESLERQLPVSAADILDHSPTTGKHVGGSLSLGELCDATIALSDNAAANLILATYGGPAAVTAFARSAGDPATRLDRTEPALNESREGDPRDTTTPAAMARTLRAVLLGDVLKPASRQQLTAWMLGTQTSGERLRKDLPAGWRLADKTGTGSNGSANDVGVFWPPGRPPVVVAVYLTGGKAPLERRNAVIATVAARFRAGA